jgi:hypothetical protein
VRERMSGNVNVRGCAEEGPVELRGGVETAGGGGSQVEERDQNGTATRRKFGENDNQREVSE